LFEKEGLPQTCYGFAAALSNTKICCFFIQPPVFIFIWQIRKFQRLLDKIHKSYAKLPRCFKALFAQSFETYETYNVPGHEPFSRAANVVVLPYYFAL
jgi:hypothetical protein